MKNITMKELHDKLSKLGADELILDVRGADEYRNGHVPGSRNIPHDSVAKHAAELKKYKTVYIHCQAGGRASMAFMVLQNFGLNNLVCVGRGGMGEWISAGLPVER